MAKRDVWDVLSVKAMKDHVWREIIVIHSDTHTHSYTHARTHAHTHTHTARRRFFWIKTEGNKTSENDKRKTAVNRTYPDPVARLRCGSDARGHAEHLIYLFCPRAREAIFRITAIDPVVISGTIPGQSHQLVVVTMARDWLVADDECNSEPMTRAVCWHRRTLVGNLNLMSKPRARRRKKLALVSNWKWDFRKKSHKNDNS